MRASFCHRLCPTRTQPVHQHGLVDTERLTDQRAEVAADQPARANARLTHTIVDDARVSHEVLAVRRLLAAVSIGLAVVPEALRRLLAELVTVRLAAAPLARTVVALRTALRGAVRRRLAHGAVRVGISAGLVRAALTADQAAFDLFARAVVVGPGEAFLAHALGAVGSLIRPALLAAVAAIFVRDVPLLALTGVHRVRRGHLVLRTGAVVDDAAADDECERNTAQRGTRCSQHTAQTQTTRYVHSTPF